MTRLMGLLPEEFIQAAHKKESADYECSRPGGLVVADYRLQHNNKIGCVCKKASLMRVFGLSQIQRALYKYRAACNRSSPGGIPRQHGTGISMPKLAPLCSPDKNDRSKVFEKRFEKYIVKYTLP